MTPEPSPKQTLLLWVILFTGIEPPISATKPKLSPKERAQMEEAGLIRLEKRGRSNHIVLTDKAWGWAAGHLDAAFSSNSPAAAPALGGLLKKLKAYLVVGDLALADFLHPRPAKPKLEAKPQAVPSLTAASADLEAAVVRAYLQASGSAWNVWVKLTEIRRRLPDVPRPDLDAALIRLEKAKRAILYPIDDPQSVRPEDTAAALVVAGFKRHIVLMRG
ncbi:MAG: hypothetical protein PHI34_09600 [Acidobacteriota bacterium]|nr:hypothetical protein [Acidobacteriota bacterium]